MRVSAGWAKQSRRWPSPPGAERPAGGEADAAGGEDLLGGGDAVGHAVDAEEAVEGALGFEVADAGNAGEVLADERSQGSEAPLQQRYVGFAVAERGEPGGLHEPRHPGDVELGEHRQGGLEVRRGHDPAEAPPGHGPGLGERVDRDDRVVGSGAAQGERRVRPAVAEPRVGVVDDEPDPVAPAVPDDRVQLLGPDGPSRGVAGAVEEHQPGAVADLVEEPPHVQRPAVRAGAQGVLGHGGAADAQRLADVGPDRADHHGAVAGVHERLGDQGQGLHARGGDRDAAGVEVDAVDAPVVGADLLAQLRLAAVGLVEVVPVRQRPPGGLHDHVRAGPATLPEPQRDHVPPPQGRLGDLTDVARRQVRRPPAHVPVARPLRHAGVIAPAGVLRRPQAPAAPAAPSRAPCPGG